jgi:hypothetical protein
MRWNLTQFPAISGGEAQTTVLVFVTIPEQAGVDAKAVVERAATILDAEINGRVGPEIGSQTR